MRQLLRKLFSFKSRSLDPVEQLEKKIEYHLAIHEQSLISLNRNSKNNEARANYHESAKKLAELYIERNKCSSKGRK